MPELWGPGLWGPGLWGAVDNPLTFDELTTYYINLLIMQYVNKYRARATVGVFAGEAVAGSIAAQVRDGFDLDVAVGAQLDILATYRGAVRTVYGLDLTRDYFAMPLYDDVAPESYHGFSVYGETPTAYWLLYADVTRPLYAMTDDELRRLTKFLARRESRFMSVKEVDDLLWAFFGAYVALQDNEDMTIEYVHNPLDPDTLFTIVDQTHNFPHPTGVLVSVS